MRAQDNNDKGEVLTAKAPYTRFIYTEIQKTCLVPTAWPGLGKKMF